MIYNCHGFVVKLLFTTFRKIENHGHIDSVSYLVLHFKQADIDILQCIQVVAACMLIFLLRSSH